MRRRTGRTKTGLTDHRLYWRGDVLWAVVPGLDGRKVRRSTGCRDEGAATARANEWERLAVDPTYAAAAATTLSGAIAKYLADHDRRRSSEAYKGKVRTKIGHYPRLWGDEFPLVKVNAALVLAYIDARQAEGAKDITIKDELGHLGQMLKLARHLGSFHETLDRVLPPFFSAGHKPRDRWPTPAEMSALVAVLEPAQAAHLVYILATGCRRGEAERARREDTDWSRRVVHIHGTKTEASEDDIPITAVNEPLLRWALERAPGREGEPLFAPWLSLNHSLEWACKRAGIAKLTPNDLRRGFGKWHVLAGVTQNAVSKLLRHTTDKLAQTTYAKVTGGEVGALVSAQIRDLPAVGFLAPKAAEAVCLPCTEPVAETVSNGEERTMSERGNGFVLAGNGGAPDTIRTYDQRFRKADESEWFESQNADRYQKSPLADVLPVYADRFGARAAAEAFMASEWGAT